MFTHNYPIRRVTDRLLQFTENIAIELCVLKAAGAISPCLTNVGVLVNELEVTIEGCDGGLKEDFRLWNAGHQLCLILLYHLV